MTARNGRGTRRIWAGSGSCSHCALNHGQVRAQIRHPAPELLHEEVVGGIGLSLSCWAMRAATISVMRVS